MCHCAGRLGYFVEFIPPAHTSHAVIILPILQMGKLTPRGLGVIEGYKATSGRAQVTSPDLSASYPHPVLNPLGFAAAEKAFSQ